MECALRSRTRDSISSLENLFLLSSSFLFNFAPNVIRRLVGAYSARSCYGCFKGNGGSGYTRQHTTREQWWEKREHPEKTHRLTATYAEIPKCKNLGSTPPGMGIEHGLALQQRHMRNAGRPRSMRIVRLEEVIRQNNDGVPSASTRSIERQMGVSHSTVWDVLSAGMQERGRISKKTQRPAVSPGTIPSCENPGATPAENRTRFALVYSSRWATTVPSEGIARDSWASCVDREVSLSSGKRGAEAQLRPRGAPHQNKRKFSYSVLRCM
ncbi:hypothetical protein PR048_015038 [Dryococelus australis]|uniref:Transposase Tc1-like domain-containing protein n=1 Tax=Dryococelus australis TaxID=614101 RepID=A0ABQ9HFW0_9NEOP|nr:hypothetical protein PR048_015038 [Dryococelus australis]